MKIISLILRRRHKKKGDEMSAMIQRGPFEKVCQLGTLYLTAT